MFPDGMIHRSPQERMRYAQVLVYIAAADGALVREEIAVIEAMMGRAMMHPESRITVRSGFEQPIPLDQSLADLEPEQVAYLMLHRELPDADPFFPPNRNARPCRDPLSHRDRDRDRGPSAANPRASRGLRRSTRSSS